MKVWARLGISLGLGIATYLMAGIGLFEDLDFKVSDQWLRLKGPQQPPPGIFVVAIDEPSYREMKASYDKPWPRSLHAQLLHRLKALGAKKVAFDVLFTGNSSDPAADQSLAEGFSDMSSAIGVESSLQTVGNQAGGFQVEQLDRPYEPYRKVAQEALVGLKDVKGFIRNFPQPRSDQEKKFPTLSQAAAGIPAGTVAGMPGPRDLIRYYGPGRTIPILSFWEVVQEDMPLTKDMLKDAVVFVGLLMRSDTGGAQKDSYQSPFGTPMVFGVEVHATIVANLLTKDWISRPAKVVECFMQGLLVAGATYLALVATPVALAITVAAIVVGWCLTSFIALGQGLFIAGAATVLVILPLAVLVSALVSYVSARRAEESLRSAFSLYVSPDMVPKLQSEGGALKLGGEKMWLTAVFTDIADFTSITEEMPAERTSEMLNAYFTEVMEVVFKNQGTLLKFIGDAIFAIWGAPIKIQNHAELALQTALAIQREVERFNASQRFPPLKTRIGVHTGPMLVGNLGSVKRFDYTAIGDSVNLTSRIEGLNKYLGTTILFTEATRKECGGFAGAVPVAHVRVKGRREAVSLYSAFDPPLSPQVLESWNLMFGAFCKADFSACLQELNGRLLSEPRLAKAASLYKSKCERYLTLPPEQGWGGEIDFDEK
jgi:adenylate cyclase